MDSSIPILIVGAGPTGLTMACELARYGISFRIIEQKTERTQTSNALGIQTRTLELLDDMGIVDRFLAVGNKVFAAHLHAEGKDIARLPLDQLDSFYQFILMVPQSTTEKILEERLAELGQMVSRETRLISFAETANGITATLQKNNKKEVVNAQYLIACDGSHSSIRENLLIPFPGEDIPQQFVVADTTLKTNLPNDELTIFFSRKKIIAFFPIETERYRIVANLGKKTKKQVSPETISQIIEKRSRGLFILKNTTWISSFWIHSNVIKNMQRGNVFFAGDSAHIHSPVGGQGMNTGIQDVYNLAWKLSLVVRGRGQTRLLESYEMERHPVIKAIVTLTEKATKFMLTANPLLVGLRNFLMPTVAKIPAFRKKIAGRLTQLAISYKKSPIINYHSVMSSKSPQPGERAPDVVLNAHTRLANIFRGTHHTLLFFTGLSPTEKDLDDIHKMSECLESRYPHLIKTGILSSKENKNYVFDEQLSAHQRYHVTYPGVYVIRPDQHIGYCANQLNEQGLFDYFANLLL